MRIRRLGMLALGLTTTTLLVAGLGDAAFGARQSQFGSSTGADRTASGPSATTSYRRSAAPRAGARPRPAARARTTIEPSTVTPPAPAVLSQLRPVGSPVLSDADAASRVRRSDWEPRPDNTSANQTVPTPQQLAAFNSFTGQWGSCDSLRVKVTGNFRGTTDEIIQWAAWKWGLPEDTLRAAAATESWWRMSMLGDNGQSYGLMQIKNVSQWHGGTFPISKDATAFNVDYYAGMVRHYFEGCATWMTDYSYNGYSYGAGDLYGSIGAWYSGDWHSDAAHKYVSDVQGNESRRVWTAAGF